MKVIKPCTPLAEHPRRFGVDLARPIYCETHGCQMEQLEYDALPGSLNCPAETLMGMTSPRELDHEVYARILTDANPMLLMVPTRQKLLEFKQIRAGHIHILHRPDWEGKTSREFQRKAAAGGREIDGPRGGWNRQGDASIYYLPSYPDKKLRVERIAAREKSLRPGIRKYEIWLVDVNAQDEDAVPSRSIVHYRRDEEAMDPSVPVPVVLMQLPPPLTTEAGPPDAGPSNRSSDDAVDAWRDMGLEELADADEAMPEARPKSKARPKPKAGTKPAEKRASKRTRQRCLSTAARSSFLVPRAHCSRACGAAGETVTESTLLS